MRNLLIHSFLIYRVAGNVCGSLFLRIGNFLCFVRLIFAIRTDWFLLTGN